MPHRGTNLSPVRVEKRAERGIAGRGDGGGEAPAGRHSAEALRSSLFHEAVRKRGDDPARLTFGARSCASRGGREGRASGRRGGTRRTSSARESRRRNGSRSRGKRTWPRTVVTEQPRNGRLGAGGRSKNDSVRNDSVRNDWGPARKQTGPRLYRRLKGYLY